MRKKKKIELAGIGIVPGTTHDLSITISQSYAGADTSLPFRVVRGKKSGPVVLLTAAIHGDELNGTGIIRELLLNPPFVVEAGTLVLVPVVNIPGLERKTRYMPDRRDLNRNFPGTASGSYTRRVAHTVFQQLVSKADYCIDFHTAAVQRTNFPNVRGDLDNPKVDRLAIAFGSNLVVQSHGIPGTLRRSATEAGHATILVEAGEVWKIEPAVVEFGVRGVYNVLVKLGMVAGKRQVPAYQARVEATKWLRSDVGGLLQFHTSLGDVVEEGQPIATCSTLLGVERGRVVAPKDGVILSLTTLPTVKPGDPVCNFALPAKGIGRIRNRLQKLPEDSLHGRLRDDLGSSIAVAQPAAPGGDRDG